MKHCGGSVFGGGGTPCILSVRNRFYYRTVLTDHCTLSISVPTAIIPLSYDFSTSRSSVDYLLPSSSRCSRWASPAIRLRCHRRTVAAAAAAAAAAEHIRQICDAHRLLHITAISWKNVCIDSRWTQIQHINHSHAQPAYKNDYIPGLQDICIYKNSFRSSHVSYFYCDARRSGQGL